MSVSFDPSATGQRVQDQMQVAVMRKQQDMLKENTMQLINSVTKVAPPSQPTGGGAGSRGIDITV